MNGTMSLSVADRVGVLRLTREARRNALDAAMVDELAALCREIERRDDLDVLLLTGSRAGLLRGRRYRRLERRERAGFRAALDPRRA